MPQQSETSIAPREQRVLEMVAKSAKTQAEVVAAFNRLATSGLVNIVTPVTAVSTLPEWTAVSFAKVDIDLAEDAGDVYQSLAFCKRGEVALTKRSLLRIMQAAGIDKVRSYQADSEGDPYYCQWTVVLRWRDFSGRYSQKEISKTIDLRDGAPATMKPEWVCRKHKVDCKECRRTDHYKTGRQVPIDDTALGQARVHLHANCETKALLRGVREYLALKQKYRVEELERPFIVPQLVPNLPMDDPDVKRAVLQRELCLGDALYPDTGRAGVANALRSHARKHGSLNEHRSAFAEPQSADEIEVEKIDADRTPAPGDQRVIDMEGPAGPEPPPAGSEAKPSTLQSAPGVDSLPASGAATANPEACTCPCKCTEVPPRAAREVGMQRLGTIRCEACYPHRGFDFERHAAIANLAIPRMEGGGTPAQVAEMLKGRAS